MKKNIAVIGYANDSEAAFNEYLLKNFSNLEVINSKLFLGKYRDYSLEIDFLIFTEKKIFVVELKSWNWKKIKINERSCVLQGDYGEEHRSSPIHSTNIKRALLRDTLPEQLRNKLKIVAINIFGDPLVKNQPIIEAHSDIKKDVSDLTSFFEILEKETRNPLSMFTQEAHQILSEGLLDIKREKPNSIKLKDLEGHVFICKLTKEDNYVFTDSEKYAIKFPLTELSYIGDVSISTDIARLNDFLQTFLVTINTNIKPRTITDNSKEMIAELTDIINSGFSVYSKRLVNFGTPPIMVISLNEVEERKFFFPIINRDKEILQITRFIESDKKILKIQGPNGCGKTRILEEVINNTNKEKISFYSLTHNHSDLFQYLLKNEEKSQLIFIANNLDEKFIDQILNEKIDGKIKIIIESNKLEYKISSQLELEILTLETLFNKHPYLDESILNKIADKFCIEPRIIANLYESAKGNMNLFHELILNQSILDDKDAVLQDNFIRLLPQALDISLKAEFDSLSTRKLVKINEFGYPEWLYHLSLQEIKDKSDKNSLIISSFDEFAKNKHKLNLIIGPRGSGKSFWSKQLTYSKNQLLFQESLSEQNPFPFLIQLKLLRFSKSDDHILIQYDDTLDKVRKETDYKEFGEKVLQVIFKNSLKTLFRTTTESFIAHSINNMLILSSLKLIEYFIDGCDELDKGNYPLYNRFFKFIIENNKLTITSRNITYFSQIIPQIRDFTFYEILPLEKEKISAFLEYKQSDFERESRLNFKELSKTGFQISNPLILEILSQFNKHSLPNSEKDLHFRLILEIAGWEIIGKNSSNFDGNFSEFMNQLGNHVILVNNIPYEVEKLIFGPLKDENDDDISLINILQNMAYCQETNKAFSHTYQKLLEFNPIAEYFVLKDYKDSHQSYPVLENYHLVDFLVIQKVIADLQKGKIINPLTTANLQKISDILEKDKEVLKSSETRKIGTNSQEILVQFATNFKLKKIPSKLLDRFDIISGTRMIAGRTSWGIPPYYKNVLNMLKHKLDDTKLNKKRKDYFKGKLLNLLLNVPETTIDMIYDSIIKDWDEPTYSVSIPIGYYFPLVKELYPEHTHKTPKYIKYLRKPQLTNCTKCNKIIRKGKYQFSVLSLINPKLDETIAFENNKYIKDLTFLFSCLEFSKDEDLSAFCSRLLLADYSLMLSDIFYLLKQTESETFVKTLILLAENQLSSWVDQDLGVVMGSPEELNSEKIKEVLNELRNRDFFDSIAERVFLLILNYQNSFNIVNWVFDELKSSVDKEVFQRIVLLLIDYFFDSYKSQRMNEQFRFNDKLRVDIIDSFIRRSIEWIDFLTEINNIFDLDLPWDKLQVSKDLINKIELANIKRFENEEEKDFDNLVFELDKLRLLYNYPLELDKLIKNAKIEDDVSFLVNNVLNGKLDQVKIIEILESQRRTAQYILFQLEITTDFSFISEIFKFRLLQNCDIDTLNVPEFVKSDLKSEKFSLFTNHSYIIDNLISRIIYNKQNEELENTLREIIEGYDVDHNALLSILKPKKLLSNKFEEANIFQDINYKDYMQKQNANNSIKLDAFEEITKVLRKIISKKGIENIYFKYSLDVKISDKYEFSTLILLLNKNVASEIVFQILQELIENLNKTSVYSYKQNLPILNDILLTKRFDLLSYLISKSELNNALRELIKLFEDYIFKRDSDDRLDYSKLNPITDNEKKQIQKLLEEILNRYKKIDTNNEQDYFFDDLIRLEKAIDSEFLVEHLTHFLSEKKIKRKPSLYLDLVRMKRMTPLIEWCENLLNDNNLSKIDIDRVHFTLCILGKKESESYILGRIFILNITDKNEIISFLEMLNEDELAEIHSSYLKLDEKDELFFKDKRNKIIFYHLKEKGILKSYPIELIDSIIKNEYLDKLERTILIDAVKEKTVDLELLSKAFQDEKYVRNAFLDKEFHRELAEIIDEESSMKLLLDYVDSLIQSFSVDNSEEIEVYDICMINSDIIVKILDFCNYAFEDKKEIFNLLYNKMPNFPYKITIVKYAQIKGFENLMDNYNTDLQNHYLKKGHDENCPIIQYFRQESFDVFEYEEVYERMLDF